MAQDERPEADAAIRRRAGLLGYAGLAPFLVLAFWLYGIHADHPWRDATIALLMGYAAVVLSALGGLRWALALRDGGEQAVRELTLGVLPGLFGWTAMALPPPFAFAVLAVAFAAVGAWDAFAAADGRLPEWFGRMRSRLTVVVVATLVVAFIATA